MTELFPFDMFIENMTHSEKAVLRIAAEKVHRAQLKIKNLGSVNTREKAEELEKHEREIERAIGMAEAIAFTSEVFDNTTDATKLLYEVQRNEKLREMLYK